MKYTESLFDFNRKPTELPSLQRDLHEQIMNRTSHLADHWIIVYTDLTTFRYATVTPHLQ